MIIPLYRIVFMGEMDESKEPATIRTALASRFKLTQKMVDRIMAGRPIVVKNNVDAEVAFKYKSEIDAIGAICRIEPMPKKADTDELGYIERRKENRRMRQDRRTHERMNAIQPDRRRQGDRRKKVE